MRKNLLKALSVVMAAGMLAACGGSASSTAASSSASSEAASTSSEAAAPAEEAVTLRLGHTQPTDHLVNTTAEKFAALVNEYTNGSVTVEVYPNSTFGSAAEMNAAVQSGDLDLYFNATAQFASQYEPISVLDAWYMFEDTEHLMNFFSGESEVYQQLFDGLEEACGIDAMGSIYYGARHMTTNTPLNTVEDLSGLKMRVASDPMPTAFFEAMGASPTPVAYNETYLALQQNVADGQENPAASILSMKFFEVQKYLNLTAHQYQMLMMFISDASKDKLSDTQLEAIYKAATEAAAEHNAAAFDYEQESVTALSESLEIVEPDLTGFMDACAKVYPEYEDTWGAGVAAAIKALA
ncbi:MAG: DctP family TRAP transporter solute-binding subunit [Gemmiger sp.]